MKEKSSLYIMRFDNVLYSILVLFTISLPFGINFNSYLIALILLLSLFRFFAFKSKDYSIKLDIITIAFILFFLYNFATIFYSQSYVLGFKEIERKASFIVFPIIFYLIGDVFERKKDDFVSFFAFATLFYVIIALCLVVKSYPSILCFENWTEKYNFRELYGNIGNKNFEMHPTYLAMYLVFSITAFAKLLETAKRIQDIILIYVSIILSCIFILFCINSRISIIALFIIFSIQIIHKNTNFLFRLLLAFCLVLIFLFVTTKFSKIENRFVREFEDPKSFSLPKGINHNSTNTRLAAIYCSLQGYLDNPYFGVGIGDAQKTLNKCYINNSTSDIMIKNKIDSHCQFVESLLIGGPILFLLCFALYFLLFKLYTNSKDILMLYFAILVTLTSLTECILSNQKGVVFFTFFTLLIFQNKKTN